MRRRLEKIEQQLHLAELVQRSMLPRGFPKLPGLDFGAAYRPLHHVSGDFFNVFRIDRDHLGLYVGDVMGHGPAAALLTVYAMLELRPKRIGIDSYEILQPAVVLSELNNALIRAEFASEPFLTLIYGVYDIPAHTWTYCSGGQVCPVVLHAGCSPRCLEPNGPLLGLLDLPFGQDTCVLEAGDRLLLFSDGVITATFGTHGPGLPGLLDALDPGAMEHDSLQPAVDDACDRLDFLASLPDDLTVLAVDILA
jgi:sigma-B regulation protein RsbU (phosphoserine phosphatase)